MYKSGFQRIERMEKVDLQDFHGFVAKGVRNTTRGAFYVFDYMLFQKDNSHRQINVALQSLGGYFLSSDE